VGGSAAEEIVANSLLLSQVVLIFLQLSKLPLALRERVGVRELAMIESEASSFL
jgi:hypothetical protein